FIAARRVLRRRRARGIGGTRRAAVTEAVGGGGRTEATRQRVGVQLARQRGSGGTLLPLHGVHHDAAVPDEQRRAPTRGIGQRERCLGGDGGDAAVLIGVGIGGDQQERTGGGPSTRLE